MEGGTALMRTEPTVRWLGRGQAMSTARLSLEAVLLLERLEEGHGLVEEVERIDDHDLAPGVVGKGVGDGWIGHGCRS